MNTSLLRKYTLEIHTFSGAIYTIIGYAFNDHDAEKIAERLLDQRPEYFMIIPKSWVHHT